MPANTVKVTRPGPYGNPFVIGEDAPFIYSRFHKGTVENAAQAVKAFRRALLWELNRETPSAERGLDLIVGLRGKNLACWCKPGEPCHADVLLELANRPICEEVA